MTTRKKREFCFSSILGKEIIKNNKHKYHNVSYNKPNHNRHHI